MLIRVFTTIFLSRDASIIIVTIYRVDCKQNASDSQIRDSSYKITWWSLTFSTVIRYKLVILSPVIKLVAIERQKTEVLFTCFLNSRSNTDPEFREKYRHTNDTCKKIVVKMVISNFGYCH